MPKRRDHGGGLDAAIAQYGGARANWLDLSTGINPVPYPIGPLEGDVWTALPDTTALDALIAAARTFWSVPDGADVVAAPGASALIAQMPACAPPTPVYIPTPTYNEHAAAFEMAGRRVDGGADAKTRIYVHPNNPDGRLAPQTALDGADLVVIDESFCDVMPQASLIAQTATPGTIVLKSFGKFWGLAGLRLGFAIGHPDTVGRLRDALGPWAVSGPALAIGTRALRDTPWADKTRARLTQDAQRLDGLMQRRGAACVGGTTLFRLYQVDDAVAFQQELSRAHILSRIFPYSDHWIRLGLPHTDHWDRVERALAP